MNPSFNSLGSVGGAVCGVLLLVAAAYGLGSLVTAKLVCRRVGAMIWLRLAVGLNLTAWLGVAAGSLGWLPGGRSGILLIVCAVLAGYAMWRERTALAVFSKRPWTWRPLAAAAVVGLVTLGPALCYPTGWDELVYHHELPRRWLGDGWPAFYADLPYSGFPSLGETLFWLVAPIENVISPRLVAWVCWIFGLALVYCLLRSRLATAPAAVLTAAFSLGGTVLMTSANCYVESILLMNVAGLLLGLESFGMRRRGVSWRGFAILGVLAGGAAAVKLTGLAVAVLPCLWYAGIMWLRPKQRPQALGRLAMIVAVSALVALPFYLRPWLLTGNPFYPYYAEWFTADASRIEMSRYHHALGDAFGLRTSGAFLFAPLLLSVADVFLGEDPLYDGAFGLQGVAVLLLGALALAAGLRRRFRPWVLWPAAAGTWLYVFWFFTAQQARFAIPAALAMFLLAAAGLQRVRGAARRRWLVLIVVLTLGSVPWQAAGHYLGSWMAALGLVSPTEYVNISTGGRDPSDRFYLPLIRALEEHVPADGRLLTLFEHRVFYMPLGTRIGTPFFQEANFTPPEQFATPERLIERLRDGHITHVLVPNAPAGPDQAPGWRERMDEFLPCIGKCERQGMLKMAWRSERYFLFTVTENRER